jgi:hypothetical protein
MNRTIWYERYQNGIYKIPAYCIGYIFRVALEKFFFHFFIYGRFR